MSRGRAAIPGVSVSIGLGQSGWDEPQVVEIPMYEHGMGVRLEHPAIESVSGEGYEK